MKPDWPRWACPDCDEPQTGPVKPKDDLRCQQCQLAETEARVAQVHPDTVRLRFRNMSPADRQHADRTEVLKAHRWPAEYLKSFEPPQEWPRHPFGGPDEWKHGIDLEAWPQNPGKLNTLLIRGDVGIGKTMLATELCWQHWLQGRSIVYTTTQTLLKAWWHDSRLLRAEVMLIDDVDRGVSGEAWQHIWAAIDARFSSHQITIGTANSSLGDQYNVNASLADRWRPGLIVAMEGTSRRIA